MEQPTRERKERTPVYDRAALVTAAQLAGDATPAALARRLRIGRTTAWRLWTGQTAPSAHVAAAVERHYGVSARQLIHPSAQGAAA
ncbi:XRE family transcriptional regulator [Streptomyces albidoflavus]